MNSILVISAEDFKCYKCSAQDSWCEEINEVIGHGSEAQIECSTKKCFIAGTRWWNSGAVENLTTLLIQPPNNIHTNLEIDFPLIDLGKNGSNQGWDKC